MGNEFEFFHKSPYGTLIWHIVIQSHANDTVQAKFSDFFQSEAICHFSIIEGLGKVDIVKFGNITVLSVQVRTIFKIELFESPLNYSKYQYKL